MQWVKALLKEGKKHRTREGMGVKTGTACRCRYTLVCSNHRRSTHVSGVGHPEVSSRDEQAVPEDRRQYCRQHRRCYAPQGRSPGAYRRRHSAELDKRLKGKDTEYWRPHFAMEQTNRRAQKRARAAAWRGERTERVTGESSCYVFVLDGHDVMSSLRKREERPGKTLLWDSLAAAHEHSGAGEMNFVDNDAPTSTSTNGRTCEKNSADSTFTSTLRATRYEGLLGEFSLQRLKGWQFEAFTETSRRLVCM